jgi:DNA-directed RNA polymerase subunit E'/Rpb7
MLNESDGSKIVDINNIYFETLVMKKVVVEPRYLTTNIDEYILKILKSRYEGKCIHEGYIKVDSMSIEKKSIGLLYGSHFTGDITYNVLFKAEVCNPMAGNIIEFEVRNKNPMCLSGVLGPMEIVIPKEMCQEDLKALNAYQIGDKIKVEVVKSRYFPNGTNIRVIGKLASKKNNVKNDVSFIASDTGNIDYEDEIIHNNNKMNNNDSEDSQSEDDEDNDDEVMSGGDESDDEIELSDSDDDGEPKEVFEMKNPNQEDVSEDEKDDNYEEESNNSDDDMSDDE